MTEIYPHPEWKRLYKALIPALKHDREFGYEELSALAGIDVRSDRGRAQFHRCAKEILRNYSYYFENQINKGYRLVLPQEHAMAGVRQLEFGRRRTVKGLAIVVYTQTGLLDDRQRAIHADVEARLGRAVAFQQGQVNEVRQIAARVQALPLPKPMKGDKL